MLASNNPIITYIKARYIQQKLFAKVWIGEQNEKHKHVITVIQSDPNDDNIPAAIMYNFV